MDIIICALCVICIVISTITIILLIKKQNASISKQDKKDLDYEFNKSALLIKDSITDVQKLSNKHIMDNIRTLQTNLTENERSLEKRVLELIKQLDDRIISISKMQEEKLNQISSSTEKQIKQLKQDNNIQLDKMRETVDEKLSKTLNERFEKSFKVLSTQLENVYKSLGEMQNVASNVNNLTKVLTNVKTTGIFGEIQLGSILEQLLTTEQYETNYVTANNREPVEFAIKLPGLDEKPIYLPIDSKFPLTVYTDLVNAYENNQFDLVKLKKEKLKNTIKSMAKDIKNKYIYPPKTTNFAIMFLPIEGLYAEVAKMGLIEELQQTFSVTIAGPTTMSALLNSLQMGFRTLAIQKKSSEVWNILGAVKTEFEKYSSAVIKIQDKFESTSKEFDALVGTRTRLINSKLKNVENLETTESEKVLGIQSSESINV